VIGFPYRRLQTPIFHTASTEALLIKLPPSGLCGNGSEASTMFNSSLVLSGECRLRAACHMQYPTRSHDPRVVLIKSQ